MALHNDFGHIGEDLAANLMINKGFKILDRNWKHGKLEIDIIAANDSTVAFVEVKTRTTLFAGKRPEEYVDRHKQRNICNAANAYYKMKRLSLTPRFDVIGIYINPITHEVMEINHLESAYYPPLRTVSTRTNSPENRWHTKEYRKRRTL